jgi:hypothetical protein
MPRRILLCLALTPLLTLAGCQPFVLTDNTATDKVLASKYWADLEKQYPGHLACWVVAVRPDSRELSIGTVKTSHLVRIRDCRVTADGRVWVNSDATMRTERWIAVN